MYDLFIHLLQAFSNAIVRRVFKQVTRFQLMQCVTRSLCNSWASCCIHSAD